MISAIFTKLFMVNKLITRPLNKA